MKKLSLLSILVLVFCFLFTSYAFADTEGSIFEKFYPVKGKYLDAETHAFEYTDTPYLYAVITAPSATFYNTNIFSDWTFGGTTYEGDGSGLKKLQYWIDLATWNTIKMAGTWTIDGQFTVTNSFTGALINSGSGNTWFEVNAPVVPEPLSSILFLLGGVALASRKLFRKKIKA